MAVILLRYPSYKLLNMTWYKVHNDKICKDAGNLW
jgi:hypothetical protein